MGCARKVKGGNLPPFFNLMEIAAALIAFLCDRWPPLRGQFDQLAPEGKRAVMLIVLALLTGGKTIVTCLQGGGLCTGDMIGDAGLKMLGMSIEAFLLLVAINQGVHLLTKV